MKRGNNLLRAVLDTNVLISWLINAHNPPGRVVDFVRVGKLRLVVDDRILAEYADVLLRSRIRKWIAHEDALDIIAFLQSHCTRVTADVIIHGLPDKGDIPFVEVATTAGVPLVTGNIKDFPRRLCHGIRIITPPAFCQELSTRDRTTSR